MEDWMANFCLKYLKPVLVISTFFMFFYTIATIWIQGPLIIYYLPVAGSYVALIMASGILYRIYNPPK